MSITKLSPNWVCQMGPIHCPKFLLSGQLSEDCEAGPHKSRDMRRHCQVPVEDNTEITDLVLRLNSIRTNDKRVAVYTRYFNLREEEHQMNSDLDELSCSRL